MIEHEFLLLGLLRESPKHGYDIKTKTQQILSLFAGIDLKSVYYPLKILEKKGLVTKHIGKAGRRPERFVYKLTKKGQLRFNQLLTESFLNFKRPQFSFDLSLYFLNYLTGEKQRRRIRSRIFILNKILKDLKKMITAQERKQGNAALNLILRHNFEMLAAEIKFMERL